MAPADGGTEASRRMHEYLLSKQRKQEEYWLRKYGKVLQAAPPSVGKPSGSPRLPPISGGGSEIFSEHSGNAGLSGSPSAGSGLLPPIHGAQATAPLGSLLPHQHHRQPKGSAPIFHANEPVKDFFTRNARQPRASGVAAGPSRDEYGNMLPPNHRPAEPYRRGMPTQLPPMGGEYGYGSQSPQQIPSAGDVVEEGAGPWQEQQDYQQAPPQPQHAYQQQQQQAYQQPNSHSSSPVSYPQPPTVHAPAFGQSPRGAQRQQHRAHTSGAMPRSLPPLQHEPSSTRGTHHGPSSGGGASSLHNPNKPLRNLEMELTVIRAIKSREDVLERLRIAGGKLDSGFGGAAPVVLSPVDPLVRLFYRLVGTLRQRTLDAIEAIAAWRRKISPSDPFIYYGVDYLAAIGPDVGFLDELPFLRSRLTFGRAADDPFLAEVTPDGIPIEEATTCDLRRGGQRFSSDALRIRMARKVLAQYCGRPLQNPSSYMLEGGTSSSDKLNAERSQQAALEDEQRLQQMLRSVSPPVVPVDAFPAPVLRAITPPEVIDAGTGFSPGYRGQVEEEGEEEERAEAQPATQEREEEQAAEPQQQEEEELQQQQLAAVAEEEEEQEEGEDVRASVDQGTMEQELEELPAEAETPADGAEAYDEAAQDEQDEQPDDLLVFQDDNDFIDFALDAIITSLEPPYASGMQSGEFTIAGWEIDQQLEEVVRGIASPERPMRTSMTSPGRGVGSRSGIVPPSRGRVTPPERQSVAPPSRGGIPVPLYGGDVTPTPPSRGGAAAAPWAGAESSPLPTPPSSFAGRIPQPPSDPKPPSRGGAAPPSRGSLADPDTAKPPSSRGSRIPTPPTAPRVPTPPSAPRPGSSGVGADGRPPVRLHLRPGSRGIDMGLSMDGAGPVQAYDAGEAPPSASGRPPVRVHLRPGSRSVGMGLSMDGEPPAAPSGFDLQGYADEAAVSRDLEDSAQEDGEGEGGEVSGRPPVQVHLRPGSRGLDMGLSMDTEAPVQPQAMDGLPAINEDGSAYFPEDAQDDGGSSPGSRPPVRVHLRPTSRDVNMGLNMDDDSPLQASVTVLAAMGGYEGGAEVGSSLDAAGRPPVRVHLRPSSREVNMGISMDGDGPLQASVDGLPPINEDLSARFPEGPQGYRDSGAGYDGPPPVRAYLRPGSRDANTDLSMDGDGPLQASVTTLAAFGEDDAEETGSSLGPASRPPVRMHLRPSSREVNMGLSMDGDGPPPPVATTSVELGYPRPPSQPQGSTSDSVLDSQMLPSLDGLAQPVQGPLSARSNRASLRSARSNSGSRPSSATPTPRDELYSSRPSSAVPTPRDG